MPLTDKGKKIMKSMKGQYGKKEGEKVFYASRNKGTIKGVERANKGKLMKGKNKKPEFIIMIALAEKKKKKNNKKG